MKRIGIFGGTFDPVHIGHMAAVRDFAGSLELDMVYLVPASVPPHKPDPPAASANDRLRMLQIAAAGEQYLCVKDLEIKRHGLSYTADTIVELKIETGDAELYLALGADVFSEISTWHRPGEVAASVNLVVLTRPGFPIDLVGPLPKEVRDRYTREERGFRHEMGTRLFSLPVAAVDVSASGIRELARKGEDFAQLVPPGVYDYIVGRGLYK